MKDFKIYDVGFKGFKGDEDDVYLANPETITYIRWGNTFFLDPDGNAHIARKGMMKFFDLRIMYLDSSAKKTSNDKSKS